MTFIFRQLIIIKQTVKEQGHPCYSFEYFPPKNKQGLMNLTERIRRMGCTQPLWVDITHSKLSKTLELAELLLDYTTVGMNIMDNYHTNVFYIIHIQV